MVSLAEIKQQILEGKEIEETIVDINWKEFEGITSEILERHEFKTWNNFRFKTKRRYEIDIVASRNNKTILIDCKHWSTGRYKSSALKKAINDQEERLEEFCKFISKNLIAKTKFKIKQDQKFSSIIVTLHEETLIRDSKSLVVPIWKLNNFLLNLDRNL